MLAITLSAFLLTPLHGAVPAPAPRLPARTTWASPSLRRSAQPDVRPAVRIQRYLEACEFFGWSGVAIVRHKGRIILHEGFGFSDRAAERPNDQETVFEIASITKPITAAAILTLVEDGSVDLDTSISEYLPDVPKDKVGITVRHLLNHTSGMSRSTGGAGSDIHAAVKSNLSDPTSREPGAAHEYWNGGYALLSAIVELQSGMDYTDFCRERLFAPAKLQHTGFTGDELWTPEQQAVATQGSKALRRASEHPYGDTYDYRYRGMGGIVTSAEELLALGSAILGGKMLKKSTIKEMLTPGDGDYGLGWGVTLTGNGSTRVSHGGDVRGFHSQAMFYPDDRAAIVLLSNVDEVPMWHLSWTIESMLFESSANYPVPPNAEGVATQLDALEGTFHLPTGGTIDVVAHDLGLELIPHGRDAALAISGTPASSATDALCNEALEILAAVREGRPAHIKARLAPRIPASWPGTLVRTIFPAHLKAWGPVESVEVVHCRDANSDHGECILALKHADGTSNLRIAFSGGQLQIFDLKAGAPATNRRFAPLPMKKGRGKAPEFATFAWRAIPGSGPPLPTLSFTMEKRKPTQLILRAAASPRIIATSSPASDR